MQTVNNSKHTVDANSETPGTANNSQHLFMNTVIQTYTRLQT